MRKFHVTVVSPSAPLFDGEANFVAAEGRDGQFAIEPGHADLVALLGAGPLRIEHEKALRDAPTGWRGGEVDLFIVSGGFLQVAGGEVLVLVDESRRKDEIDVEACRAQLTEVLAELQHPKDDVQFERLLQRRRWCEARIRLAQIS